MLAKLATPMYLDEGASATVLSSNTFSAESKSYKYASLINDK